MKDHGYVDSPLIGNYPTVKTAAITFDDVKMAEDAMEDDADHGVIVCKNQTELDAALKKRCREQFEAGLDKPKSLLRRTWSFCRIQSCIKITRFWKP